MSLVALETRDEIAILTLDRPRANAFSPELVAELSAAFAGQEQARGIVLASALPGIFSAGWDLPLLVDIDRKTMKDPVVLALGQQLLRYLALSGLFVTVALCYTGALQGTGDTRGPLYISIVSQIVVPLGLCWIIRHFGTLEAGDIWRAILFGHITRCVLTVLRFRQGHWRHITVDIDRRAASH